VPHTEVGRIIINREQSDFTSIVCGDDLIDVFGQSASVRVIESSILRPDALVEIKFLVDVNVAKLGALLRMVGIDAAPAIDFDDQVLAQQSAREGRILLSRDRNLLRRKIVMFGRLVRAENPEEQLVEVIQLYDLLPLFRPFTRCMRCNGLLRQVEKEEISHRLEPLTEKYYNTFHVCRCCNNLYWPGTHRERMEELLRRIVCRLDIDCH